MNYKSHTKEEIIEALRTGKNVYELDTDQAGNDDVLIGTEEECRNDILNYLDISEWPDSYMLRRVDLDEIETDEIEKDRYEGMDSWDVWDRLVGQGTPEEFIAGAEGETLGDIVDAYLNDVPNMFGADEALTADEHHTCHKALVRHIVGEACSQIDYEQLDNPLLLDARVVAELEEGDQERLWTAQRNEWLEAETLPTDLDYHYRSTTIARELGGEWVAWPSKRLARLKGAADEELAREAERVHGEVKYHKGIGEPVVAVKWPREWAATDRAWWFIRAE